MKNTENISASLSLGSKEKLKRLGETFELKNSKVLDYLINETTLEEMKTLIERNIKNKLNTQIKGKTSRDNKE